MQRLLLHVCCAPCSTHPIEVLSGKFNLTAFFFNPNIYPPSEYAFRKREALEYFESISIHCISIPYQRREWLNAVAGNANEPEGGARCRLCFDFRLRATAELAANGHFDWFSTTLTIGPNKPANVIFPICETLAREYGVSFYAQDFKKKDGYRRSCLLSRESGMYRQNYCGCEYSYRDRCIRDAQRGSQI